jgi:hypothetical protein
MTDSQQVEDQTDLQDFIPHPTHVCFSYSTPLKDSDVNNHHTGQAGQRIVSMHIATHDICAQRAKHFGR